MHADKIRLIALAALLVWVAITPGRSDSPSESEIPRSLPRFVRALDMGIVKYLPPEELKLVKGRSSDELRESHPELYAKIRRNVKLWTDEWVQRAMEETETVSLERIGRAKEKAIEVDTRLRAYFDAKGWPYRTLSVVFLPQRLLYDRGGTAKVRGMYMPYYPEAFFATLDPHSPVSHTFVHENLHFNKAGPEIGRTLSEGIVEVASEHLGLKWGFVSKRELRNADYYRRETKLVEDILEGMMEQTGLPRDEMLEILLSTYLTGDSTRMNEILGTDAWSRIIKAAKSHRDVAKVRKIAKQAMRH